MNYQELPDGGMASSEVPANENNEALGQAFTFSHLISDDTGLDVGIAGGPFLEAVLPNDTVTCTDDDDTYIVAHRTTGAVTGAITTTNWNNTATYGRVGIATFLDGVLTGYIDARHDPGGIYDHGAASGFGDVVGPASSTDSHFAQFDGTTGKLLKGGIALDTDVALAANSDTKLASQKAVKAYVDALLAGADAVVFKGVIDCSANPNYPAADAGHIYIVSVAGLIGGGSGVAVEAGDMLLCRVDATASGTQAAVGANWSIVQTNLVSGGGQVSIQFKDEGSNLGSSGAVTGVDFVGAGVTASFSGGTVTVTIGGGGGGSAQDAQAQTWMGL